MNFYEKEAAEEQKRKIWMQQGGRCAECKLPLPWEESQAAHRIPKHKWIIKKYGAEVIHHRFNIKVTHCGNCNDAVMIMPESVPALKLIKEIQEDLNVIN